MEADEVGTPKALKAIALSFNIRKSATGISDNP
jgi:hypothetical protein